jgi:hypothetical protein
MVTERKRAAAAASDTGNLSIEPSAIVNGAPVGIFRGYAATWAPDTGGIHGCPDQFVPGAFARTLEEHRERGDRPIRLKLAHGDGAGAIVGSIPIASVREDDRGLFVEGQINLDSQLGRGVFSMIRQGALSDLSVGFVTLRERFEQTRAGKVRLLEEVILREVSIVDEPCNEGAVITQVKAAPTLEDVLENLRAARDDLRQTKSASDQSDLRALLDNLRGAREDLRRPPVADDRASMRALLRNLQGARADLRRVA